MGKICLCLTGKTLAQNLEILDRNRKHIDIVELRADCLIPNERFLLRRFPEMAGVPVILTIRRGVDGGSFHGGEGSRITLLANGLAYADADRRRNFAYVDLEEDLNVPSLEEAARAFGTRVIRSWHNLEGVDDDLGGKLRKLKRVGDEIVKAALVPRSLDDVFRVYQTARETKDIDKVFFCMGEYSANTSILAGRLDSKITYTFPAGESGLPPAPPGLLDPKELAELYRFHELSSKTKILAVAGYPLKLPSSPRFFNNVFRIEQTDAVYIPIPADSIHSLIRLGEEIGVSGCSIAAPYKEDVLSYLANKSKEVLSIGACNVIIAASQGWAGYNTNSISFSASLLSFIGRKDFRRRKLTIIGAGGSARAVAAEVHRLKGKALILNRTVARARALAEPYRFAWAGLDSRGADLMEKYSDIIIQTSPVGVAPHTEADPIDFYKFSGRETVMDLIYNPEKTLCLRRAEEAGCRILNGYDMILRQLRYHYTYFVDKEFPPSLINRVGI